MEPAGACDRERVCMIMSKTAILTVQQWGNSLAVRIPAAVTRSARFQVGQPVEVSAQDSNVLVRSIGEPKPRVDTM
jgi:antitoxin MazE